MIRTEAEYRRTLVSLEKGRLRIEEQKRELKARGLDEKEVEHFVGPAHAFLWNFENDIQWYERAKRGEIPTSENLETLGRVLVALRISKGMTQGELAKALAISQSQVSQDENDEYHGISIERAQKILKVFGLEGQLRFTPSGRREAA
jgi:DNA-binding XRE family transcriptional regulator